MKEPQLCEIFCQLKKAGLDEALPQAMTLIELAATHHLPVFIGNGSLAE